MPIGASLICAIVSAVLVMCSFGLLVKSVVFLESVLWLIRSVAFMKLRKNRAYRICGAKCLMQIIVLFQVIVFGVLFVLMVLYDLHLLLGLIGIIILLLCWYKCRQCLRADG